jgi:pimeloyl-ACP methyl ester carboxylesterase
MNLPEAQSAHLNEWMSRDVVSAVPKTDPVEVAAQVFCTPIRTQRRPLEFELLKEAVPLRLQNGVMAFTWGDGPKVLLVHGWCGRGTQLAAYIKPLLDSGCSVVALDCWGHGDSPGNQSHGVKFAESILACSAECGEFSGAVAHSVGAAALLIALSQGMKLQRATLLAPPSILNVMRRFAAAREFDEPMTELFIQQLEDLCERKREDVDCFYLADRVNTPLLIIHDEADRDVPFSDSVRFAQMCPSARLEKASGVGHLRLLKDKNVVAKSVEFVAGIAT